MRISAFGVIAAANIALAAGLVLLWSDAERFRWSAPQPMPPSLDDKVAASTSEAVDVSRFRETIERPLFASTRRPAPRGEGGDAPAAVDPLKDLRLLGLYGAPGRGGIIVSNGGKVERVAIGQKIGDWTVESEKGRSAALVRSNGERREVALVLNTNAVTPPASAAAGNVAESAAAAPSGAAAATRSAAAQRVAAQRAAARRAGAVDEDARRQQVRQITERINARRAQRGLPPIKEQ